MARSTLGPLRYDSADGGKRFYPARWNDGRWQLKAPTGQHPLFALPRLLTNGTLPVLIVEGEKTAHRAQELAPWCVVVTSFGGSSAFKRTDWAPSRSARFTSGPTPTCRAEVRAQRRRARAGGWRHECADCPGC